jgi:SAM-dependent methyltransferase
MTVILPVLTLMAGLGVGAAVPQSSQASTQDRTSQQQAAHDDHGARPDEARIHRYERQEVVLEDFAADGYVLDIGGGGEGIIGQLKPQQVVAIDINARELLGAPAGPLKIVMDATDLKFLDETFRTATSFFTLMYMKPEDQERALRELHRVLQPGGRLLVWDVILPVRADPVKDIAVFPLTVRMPGREVKTGYGTFFPPSPHDVPYFVAMAQRTGFSVRSQRESGRTFYLELWKP